MTTTNVATVEAAEPVLRETENSNSLPACLERTTADGHKPTIIVGMVSNGDWLPPVALSEFEASALKGALETFAQALEPARSEVARALLSRLAMSCRLEAMPEEAWRMHLDDFVTDLSDVPEDLIAEGCRLRRRREKFWPMISEFLALIEPELAWRRRTFRRLQVLARVASNPAPDGIATREWIDLVVGPHATLSRGAGMRPIGQVLDQATRHATNFATPPATS